MAELNGIATLKNLIFKIHRNAYSQRNSGGGWEYCYGVSLEGEMLGIIVLQMREDVIARSTDQTAPKLSSNKVQKIRICQPRVVSASSM